MLAKTSTLCWHKIKKSHLLVFLCITNILKYPPLSYIPKERSIYLLSITWLQWHSTSARFRDYSSWRVPRVHFRSHWALMHFTQCTTTLSQQEEGPQSQPMGPNWQNPARETISPSPSQKKTKSRRWCRIHCPKRHIPFLVSAFSCLDHKLFSAIQAWEK